MSVSILTQRKNSNISQRLLAKKVGLTDSAICQYESGKRSPSIPILKKIAEVLNCTVDDLIKEDKEEEWKQ